MSDEQWAAFVQSIGEAGDLRPVVQELIEEHSELFEIEARNMTFNGQSRGAEHWVEHGRALGAIVLAAQWWARDWRENQRTRDALAAAEQRYEELRDERALLWPQAQVLPIVEAQRDAAEQRADTAEAKVRQAHTWIKNCVDPLAVGADVKASMLAALSSRPVQPEGKQR